MRTWRAHPVRLAALIGAITGFLVALSIEIGGAAGRNPNAVVRMLLPAADTGIMLSEGRLMQASLILVIEIVANVAVYALMFALPVAIVVLVRRVLGIRQPHP